MISTCSRFRDDIHTFDAGAFLLAGLVFGSGAGLVGCEATRVERRGSAAGASESTFFLGGIVVTVMCLTGLENELREERR